jgi:thiamine pyrophosphokinase
MDASSTNDFSPAKFLAEDVHLEEPTNPADFGAIRAIEYALMAALIGCLTCLRGT